MHSNVSGSNNGGGSRGGSRVGDQPGFGSTGNFEGNTFANHSHANSASGPFGGGGFGTPPAFSGDSSAFPGQASDAQRQHQRGHNANNSLGAKKKVCKFFASSGTCRFGNKCKFSHDVGGGNTMQSNAFTQNTFQETQQQATGFGSKQVRSGFSQAQQQQRQKQLDPFGQPQQHQQFAGFAQKQQQPDPFSRQQVQPQLSPTPPQQQHQRQQHQPNVFAQQPHVFAQPAGGFTSAQQNADPKIDPFAQQTTGEFAHRNENGAIKNDPFSTVVAPAPANVNPRAATVASAASKETPLQDVTTAAKAQMAATVTVSADSQDISSGDIKEFQAVEFTFGKIPLSEPPANCCVDIHVPI